VRRGARQELKRSPPSWTIDTGNTTEQLHKESAVLALILSVCSIVEGAACRELPPIPLLPNTTMAGCLMASQIEGAKWAVEHPNFYVQRATCQPHGKLAQT
jgi:hypothetical protein